MRKMVRTLFALTHFLMEERLALCTNFSTVLFTDISHCRTLTVVFHCTIVYKQPSPFLHCLIRKLIMVLGYILVLVLRLHQTKYSVSCHSDFISGYCRLTVNRKSPNPPPSEVSEGCKPLSARTYLDMPKQHYCEHLIPTASSSVKTNNHPALLTSDPFLPTISPFSSVLYFILQPAIAPYTHPLCFFGIGTTTLILPSECIIPNLQQQLNYVGECIALRGERK